MKMKYSTEKKTHESASAISIVHQIGASVRTDLHRAVCFWTLHKNVENSADRVKGERASQMVGKTATK